MNHNDIVIYGFNLGNADPAFKEFVYSLTNYDVHNIRMILYKQLYNLEQNGVSAALHGRDSYGIIIVPEKRKEQLWQKSDELLFDYLKNLWVATVLGYSDPGMNPFKIHAWKITRIRAVTTRNEGWKVITAAMIEIGLAYLGTVGYMRIGGRAIKQSLLKTRVGQQWVKFPHEFPKINDGYGVFGENGLRFRNYKVEMMYRNSPGSPGGTIFSIDEEISMGNRFRIDFGFHEKVNPSPFWHYHLRYRFNNKVYGSTRPRPFK